MTPTSRLRRALARNRRRRIVKAVEQSLLVLENITVASRGESENAVPTADGVMEQANRRVEIILQ